MDQISIGKIRFRNVFEEEDEATGQAEKSSFYIQPGTPLNCKKTFLFSYGKGLLNAILFKSNPISYRIKERIFGKNDRRALIYR
ncbi:hypothetical protein HP456_19735 [Bacillus haikouensis]|uniref:hypothetical protein n=1 Tax=Bacillus haikouensis TaxID=1510468 RepID=UPI0015564C39|nr:hypothetical protein [Bacillus haikouensis]NQD68142.1 hypothetical protein [Bacillus haikouensis]